MKKCFLTLAFILFVATLNPSKVYASGDPSIGTDEEALLYTAYHRGLIPISQVQLPDDSTDSGISGLLENFRTVGRILSGEEKYKFLQDGEYLNCKVDIHNSPDLKHPFNDGKASVRIHDCDGGKKLKLKVTEVNGKNKVKGSTTTVLVSEVVDQFDISVAHQWYQNLKGSDKSGLVATQNVKGEVNRSPAVVGNPHGELVAGNIE